LIFEEGPASLAVVRNTSHGVNPGRQEVMVKLRNLGFGHTAFIPAHKKHRVEWTDPVEQTIWLAVHY
jgi:hypothetical protein